MQDKPTEAKTQDGKKLPDEDGTVMIYGFVQIKDKNTGKVLVSTRS